MKLKTEIQHLTIWNCFLFIFIVLGIDIYGIITANLFGILQLVWVSELLLAVFLVVVSLEAYVALKLSGGDSKNLLTPLLLTHSPWLLGFALGALPHIHLPGPHDFLLRKFEILFGLMWVSHLFLYSRFLLNRSYKKGLRNSTIFGIVAALLFTGVTVWTARVCDLSGDEPHYLLMAYSLIHDGDLDLSNNYANKDYEKFYHRGELQPQALEHVVNGKRYSHHPLGPVLLVLPGFALFGRMGAALTMALLAALALFLTLRVIEETEGEGWFVHATGIIGLFSSPFLLFSGLIYPEIPTACLVALGLFLFIRNRWLGLGVALGAMLWMHNRNVLLVMPFLFILLFELWKNKKKWEDIGKLAAGFLLPVAALALCFYSLYGVITPLGAHNEPFESLFRLSHFWVGFFGLIFDQECGFCFHYPVFALMVTGGALLYLSKNPVRRLAIGVALFYFLFMSFYENLGLTPAARYFVSIVPLLLVLVYPMVKVTDKGTFAYYSTAFALAVGAFFNWVLAAVPWMRYNKLNGENWVLKIAGGFLHTNLNAGAPSFQIPVIQWQSYAISIFWVVVTIAGTILYFRDRRVKAMVKKPWWKLF